MRAVASWLSEHVLPAYIPFIVYFHFLVGLLISSVLHCTADDTMYVIPINYCHRPPWTTSSTRTWSQSASMTISNGFMIDLANVLILPAYW